MSDDERVERELKFRCADLNDLRDRIKNAEAERTSPAALEDNLIFDRNGELQKRGCLLRLRYDAHGARLTFKGPARFEEGVKIREERETGVEAPEELCAVLQYLGYETAHRYQKLREEWRLGGVVVCLDRTPIGDFVEFEGDAAGKLAERFGFELSQAERSSYIGLYQEHRRSNPTAPVDMIFS